LFHDQLKLTMLLGNPALVYAGFSSRVILNLSLICYFFLPNFIFTSVNFQRKLHLFYF